MKFIRSRSLPWAALLVLTLSLSQWMRVFSNVLALVRMPATTTTTRTTTTTTTTTTAEAEPLVVPAAANRNVTTTPSKRQRPPQKRGYYYYRPLDAAAADDDDTFGGVRARSFPRIQQQVPCWKPEPTWKAWETQTTPTDEGLLFLKTYKTGSSTAAGIHLRISRNVAARRQDETTTTTGNDDYYETCKTRFDHAWASALYWNRNPKRSFLWTIVRDPTSRILSQLFHFHVSRENQSSSDESLMARIGDENDALFQDYYIGSLSIKGYKTRSQQDPVRVANDIIRQYDFIAVTERMEESAVALAMILGIPLADVLFLKAKGQGGYDDAGGTGTCTYITPSFVSPGMRKYFDSDVHQDMVQFDYLLYQAANRSLDLTIASLGRERFQHNLSVYHKAQALAVERCTLKTRFPCTPTGKKNVETDCLWKDSGCGYQCLDHVATELGLWSI